jgi:hypothetical protein
MVMDRNKIKDAWQLHVSLENLEWKIQYCKDNPAHGNIVNLLEILSPLGREKVWAATLCEAEMDRIELERKIAEL